MRAVLDSIHSLTRNYVTFILCSDYIVSHVNMALRFTESTEEQERFVFRFL